MGQKDGVLDGHWWRMVFIVIFQDILIDWILLKMSDTHEHKKERTYCKMIHVL